MNTNYDGYTVRVSNDPSYYGNVTNEQAARIASDLTTLIEGEFPGVTVETVNLISGLGVTGPDELVIDEIMDWVANNWTSVL